jgi:hypothetical protein
MLTHDYTTHSLFSTYLSHFSHFPGFPYLSTSSTRILPMQTVHLDLFASRAEHILHRGSAHLAGVRSGVAHHV